MHRVKQHRSLINKVAIGATMAMFAVTPFGEGQLAHAASATAVAADAVQPQTVNGVVLDQAGEPVIGATVKVKGGTAGTMTDVNGAFSLKVPANSTLEVTFIGYVSQILKVTPTNTHFDIVMTEDAHNLDEVVVVGYGQQKKVNLSGSVSSINVSELAESRPVNNVSQALAGLASGVSVVSANNQPGNDNATINIRGVGTLNTSTPLVIIDGVEAGINTVNPQDIESMSILKDAASASIYGSRAANGVILITTKKGKKGAMKVEYNGYVSFNSIRKTLTPVSNYADYMDLINEGYFNSYNQKNYVFTDEVITKWRTENDPLKYPNTNWIEETFKPSTATTHTLSMSGGTDQIRFYGSFGFLTNPGVMPNAGFTKYSGRVSVDADLKPWLTLGIYANGYVSDMDPAARYASSGTIVDDIFTYASATTPGMVFQAPDGRFGAMNNDQDDSQCAVNNPISRAYRVDGNIRKNNMRTRFVATIRPYKGVSVTGSYSYEVLDEERRRKPNFVKGWNFLTETVTYDSTSKTSVMNNDGKVERYINDLVAHYDGKFFNDLGVNVMLGTSHELYHSKSFQASKQDLVDLSLWALSAATGDASASGSSTEWAMNSYFGRINLNWADKYLLEFNLRADGSSRFLDGKRWGWFPSGSAAWRLEQEPFMESIVEKGLNNLKLRLSYGSLGNNSVGNYDALALYTNANSSYEIAYALNGALATGLAQVALSNPLLTWESTKIADVGVDFGLFRNRLSVTADYFHKKTDNILINLPAPAVHGTTSIPKVNSAEVVNQGIEISAGWMDNVRDFKYGVNLNFTYVTNKVTKFKGKGKDGMSISGANLIWEGHPINSQYTLVVDRIVQTDEDLKIVQDMIDNAPIGTDGKKVNPFAAYGTPQKGDLLYKDINGDGVVNTEDRAIVADGPNPKYMLGLNLSAEWKGNDLSVLIRGSFGGKRYWQSTAYNTPTVRKGYQINKEVADGRWYEGRTDATYPRLLYYEDKINQQVSDFYLQNLDFVKIRNIQLGYTLPKKWVNACTLERVRIYGTLENFLTFTGFKGFDPEVSGLNYPTMRQAVVGLNVTF